MQKEGRRHQHCQRQRGVHHRRYKDAHQAHHCRNKHRNKVKLLWDRLQSALYRQVSHFGAIPHEESKKNGEYDSEEDVYYGGFHTALLFDLFQDCVEKNYSILSEFCKLFEQIDRVIIAGMIIPVVWQD